MNQDKTKPAIILVKPQMGENIGAAARAMMNFGLSELRIVAPRDGWPNGKAIDMAKHAKKILDDAKIYDSTKEAATGLTSLYATTARERDMAKEAITPMELATQIESHSGILFGAERTGLNNEDIAICDKIIHIPTSKEYPSINIAQAVNIICYQIFEQTPKKQASKNKASKEDIIGFFEHLEEELEKSNFYKTKEIKPKMILNIRNMFTKANLTEQEVRTLRGMIRALANDSTRKIT